MSEAKSDSKEKLKALQLTIDKLEKTYGKGTVMKLNDTKVMDVVLDNDLQTKAGMIGSSHDKQYRQYGMVWQGKPDFYHAVIFPNQRGQ